MITYFIEVTICWAGFYGLYTLLLSKTTFFRANRYYLLGTMLLGLAVPLLPLPSFVPEPEVIPVVSYLEPVSVGVEQMEITVTAKAEESGFDYMAWLKGAYLLGLLIFASRFFYGLWQIWQLFRKGTKEKYQGYTLVRTEEPHLPFSFFHYVFWSRKLELEGEDEETILRHEEAHVSDWHSLDVLLSELLCLIMWCSPMVYFYRRSLRTVHEYLADNVVLQTTRRKKYGHLLLRQSQSGLQVALANHFLQPQLKKRIMMMTRHQTPDKALLRYLLALPLLVLFLLTFANRELIGQTLLEIQRADGTVESHTIQKPEDANQLVSPDQIATINVTKAADKKKIVVTLKQDTIPEGKTNNNIKLNTIDQDVQYEIHYPDGRVEVVEQTAIKEISPSDIASVTVQRDQEEKQKGRVIIVLKNGNESDSSVTLRSTEPNASLKASRIELHYPDGSVKTTDEAGLQKVAPSSIERVNVVKSQEDGQKFIQVYLKEGAESSGSNAMMEVDEMPRLPGCEEFEDAEEQQLCAQKKLLAFVYENLQYPEKARKEKLSGTVVVKFVVDETGQVTNAKVVKEPGGGTGEEVLRVMSNLPTFVPGKKDGKPVAVEMALPVKFQLQKEQAAASKKNGVYKVVDEMPRFPGCEDAATVEEKQQCANRKMLEFIYTNILYPKAAREAHVQGTAVVSFVIDTEGRITSPEVVRDIGAGIGEEMLRVVSLMAEEHGPWTPGKQDGKAVPVEINLPVKFKLDGVEKAEQKVQEPNEQQTEGEKVVNVIGYPSPKPTNTLQVEAFNASPNPTGGQLQLRFRAEAAPTLLRVTDLNGREILRRQLNDFDGAYDEALDLSNATKGVLLLSIHQGDKVFTEKVVLQ